LRVLNKNFSILSNFVTLGLFIPVHLNQKVGVEEDECPEEKNDRLQTDENCRLPTIYKTAFTPKYSHFGHSHFKSARTAAAKQVEIFTNKWQNLARASPGLLKLTARVWEACGHWQTNWTLLSGRN
jgi:hypothetical protein